MHDNKSSEISLPVCFLPPFRVKYVYYMMKENKGTCRLFGDMGLDWRRGERVSRAPVLVDTKIFVLTGRFFSFTLSVWVIFMATLVLLFLPLIAVKGV